jgi:hypothetical protein
MQQPPQQQQAQQNVYYPIPSVVTLPIESQGDQSIITSTINDLNEKVEIPVNSNQQTNIAQPQVQTLQQPQDQVTGMVGAIPIVNIQGATVHYVQQKKGRFRLLQETRHVAPTSCPPRATAGIPMAGVVSPVPSHVGTQTPPAAIAKVPNNIEISTPAGHSNVSVAGRSNTSMVSVLSSTAVPSYIGGNTAPVPQTFDGTSAPSIKKKGRFVVTNVRDPGSFQSIRSRQNVATAASTETPMQLQPPPQIPTMAQQQPSQPIAPNQATFQQQSVEAENALQSVQSVPVQTVQAVSPFFSLQGTTILTDSYTGPVGTIPPPLNQQQYVYQTQTHHPPSAEQPSQPIPPNQATFQQQGVEAENAPQSVQSVPVQTVQVVSPFFSLQGATILTDSYTGPVGTIPPPLNQQQYVYQTQTHCPPSAPQRPPEIIVTTVPADAPHNSQGSTPPQTTVVVPTPAGTNTESPRRPHQTNSKPAAEAPRSAEKPRIQQNGTVTKKALVQTRKTQSDRNGTFGLGKLCYFLDQMKSEVTDADQLTRTLQTDLKVLVSTNGCLVLASFK